ncbi:hypothetical protein [Mangrovicella endophytica]|uniref:hypothetical protein n=1 Tax=Mangrovicella endophytica TaxID=2066697 RepID=UPI0012FFF3BF|nr:hypothetical protein [Mangrovicella endophytica]
MSAVAILRVVGADEAPMVLPFPRSCPTSAAMLSPPAPTDAERMDLDRLRWLALRSQLAPRPDLEQACYVLAGEPDASFERFSIQFFRGLSGKARRSMTFYRPGARAISDDERWLLRLVSAWRRGDDAGAKALVAWRVSPESQRWLRFLSAGMVRAMDARS